MHTKCGVNVIVFGDVPMCHKNAKAWMPSEAKEVICFTKDSPLTQHCYYYENLMRWRKHGGEFLISGKQKQLFWRSLIINACYIKGGQI